jgi:hypothetical protein
MPSTDIRDKSEEQNRINDRRIPLWISITIYMFICLIIGGFGYFVYTLFF